MKKIDNQELIGHAAMFFANIIWGIMAPVSKYLTSLESVSAFAVTGYRIIGACILFWIASIFTKKENVPNRDKFRLILASMLAVIFNQGTFVSGVALTSPINASVITTVLPIITMVLSAIILKEPITSKKVIGIALGLSGALILVIDSSKGYSGDSNIIGDLLCLFAQFSFAFYVVLFKELIGKYSPITIMKYMFLGGAVIFGPFLAPSMIRINYSELPLDAYFGLGHTVILGTFVAYFMIPIGQHRLRPTVVVMYNYVQPIVSGIVSLIVGLSTFSVWKGIATFLVFMGVWIVTQSKSRADIEKEKNKINNNN